MGNYIPRLPRPATEAPELDEHLVEMARTQTRTEKPDSGFVSTMRHTPNGEIDGLLIYAWGESARTLAENLKLRPARPDGRPHGVRIEHEQIEKPKPRPILPPGTDGLY